jgi:hypothetical protein
MNANSYAGSLFIDAIDAVNNVTGRTQLRDEPEIQIRGAWDESTGKLDFIRLDSDPNQLQSFTGFLFNDGSGKTLAGTFQVYKGNTINGLDVGWYAHIDLIF